MGAKSVLTERQWVWVCDRYREGYRQADLAEFLGMSEAAVRRQLKRRCARPPTAAMLMDHPGPLTILENRKKEFFESKEESP